MIELVVLLYQLVAVVGDGGRVVVCTGLAQVVKNGMSLLGIEVPERM